MKQTFVSSNLLTLSFENVRVIVSTTSSVVEITPEYLGTGSAADPQLTSSYAAVTPQANADTIYKSKSMEPVT